MQFSNQFEVSLPPEEAWALLMDVQAVVPCMPGAEIVSITDDRNFRAKVAVRLGPVAMVFVCDLAFVEIDHAAMTATVKAQGADAKGRGSAEATVDFRCLPSATGTLVRIGTDLSLSGAVAQYGRGVGLIQTVANQVISQFSRNLELRIEQLKAHGASFGVPDAPPVSAAPAIVPHGTAVQSQAPTSTAAPTVTGDYPQGYREGYGAGFSAGHAAGFALACQMATDGRSSSSPPLPATTLSGSRAPLPPFSAKPIGGFSLATASLWAGVRSAFSRHPR